MQIVILYTIFAVISTETNIWTQKLSMALYSGPFALYLSVAAGIGTGLLVKYFLDKKFIFKYRTENLSHDTRLFALYTSMGIITTLVFLGFEFGFFWYFGTEDMRYLGGRIGLAIGYFTKYHLDKRFVFKRA